MTSFSFFQQSVPVLKEERIKSLDFDWRNPYSASKLSKAVRLNNFSMVRKLINAGCDLDSPDNRGYTPLHDAATNDKFLAVAKLLIDAGAYIEHKTVDGESPLIVACKCGAEKIVKLLISAGAIVNTRNNEHLMPLHIACAARNINILRFLLRHGANIEGRDDEERTPVYHAIDHVNTTNLKMMMEAGANMHSTDFFSRTPLQYSCMVGNLEIFGILLDRLGRGKDVIDQQTPEGWTLLMEAAQYKNYLIAEKLIEFGADTTLVDNRNLLAVHIAAHCERHNILELFLKHTPMSAIEMYSTLGQDMTHYRSLPCLIIDKNAFDALELLFEYGLSRDVLTCPVQMGNQILSPISFLLLYANIFDNDAKVVLLEYLLQFDFLLDPEYELEDYYPKDYLTDNEVKVVSPIEAALIMHRRGHRDCYCEKFLFMILSRGVSPDKVPTNLGGGVNAMYLFGKAVQLDFVSALDLLFKYSERTEPGDVLKMIVMGAINDLHIPIGDEKNIVKHLASKCTHEVNSLAAFVSYKLKCEDLRCKTRLKTLKGILRNNTGVPSLKRLSRFAVRKDVRDRTQTSSTHTFREYIQNMTLPPYITRYLLYEIDF